jgi:hypothetical protein
VSRFFLGGIKHSRNADILLAGVAALEKKDGLRPGGFYA